jgi:hypothetical protein
MLHESLRSLRNYALSNMVAPALQFFTPKESFFQALEAYKTHKLIEAGAGLGRVAKEAAERGFDVMAIDIMPREDQWECVIQMDAESMPYGPGAWLLMCRPDHSGWAYDTLEVALKRGAGVFYAGLERNFEVDLGDYIGRETAIWRNVGEDGEDLLLFMPEALLPEDSEGSQF